MIHSFTGPDGAQPFAHMTLEKKNPYGTTAFGGANNAGTIYKLNPKTNAEMQLYAFTGNADGKNVVAGTVFYDNALWGTTYTAGAHNYGTLFKFDLATNTETTLHAFASGTDAKARLPTPSSSKAFCMA